MANDTQAKRDWVGRVLGIVIPDRPQTPEVSDDPLDLKNRMATAARQINAFKAEGDPALPALLAALAAARAAMQGGTPDAGALMDTLEREIARALSAARGRTAKSENAGVVEHAKLLLRWRRAQADVLSHLKQLGASILGRQDFIDDRDYEEVCEVVADLPDLIPEFGDQLDDILDAASDPDADLRELSRDGLEIVEKYRAAVNDVAELRALEAFSAEENFGTVQLYSAFNAALDEIETELRKAV